MAKLETKNTWKLIEEGTYNPETGIMISCQKNTEGEETDILDYLSKMAKDGEVFKITIQREEKTDDINFDEDSE